jgi:dihydroorotate dehydrogenase electron transfer subunit
MTNPLHAAHYADDAVQLTAEVSENVRIAEDTYRLRIACPDIARRIVPGQFVMLRMTGLQDPLIGRPFALYDTVLSPTGERVGIDVVYLVHGKLTHQLADCTEGQHVDIWGPLGNGFPPAAGQYLVMVAGGIGQTPFVALAREALGQREYGSGNRATGGCRQVTLCYGARTANRLAGIPDFEDAGVEVLVATEDGSMGKPGLVSELLRSLLEQGTDGTSIVSCGPEPMLKAVSEIAQSAEVPCQVSLETPMACGIGICFTCVAKVRDAAGGWDYKRTCVDGPVFDAAKIVW